MMPLPSPRAALAAGLVAVALSAAPSWAASPPANQRGRSDAERAGQHDTNNIRTIF